MTIMMISFLLSELKLGNVRTKQFVCVCVLLLIEIEIHECENELT